MKYGIAVWVLLLVILSAYFFYGYGFLFEDDIYTVFKTSAVVNNNKLLPWENSLNLQQTHNTCGPYSVMAYAYGKNKLKLDPEEVNKNIGGRYGDGMTYPEGIVEYLNRYHLEARIYFIGWLSRKKKLEWIQQKIESGNPVILVVGNAGGLHYITILGYKNDILYVYDSVLSEDRNFSDPGNLSENYISVMKRLESAFVNGVAINLAISN